MSADATTPDAVSPHTAGTADAASFRRAMRWYPPAWRAEHGDAMLGALLDQADAEGRRSPGIRDRAELAWHGVRERARRSALVLPAPVRDRAATLGLGAAVGLAVVLLFGIELAPRYPWITNVQTLGPFRSWFAVAYLAIVATWVLALLGFAKLARGLVVCCAAALVGARVVGDATGITFHMDWTTTGTLVMFLLLAAIGRVGSSARSAATLAIVSVIALAGWALPYARYPAESAGAARSYFTMLWPMGGVGASDWFPLVPVTVLLVAIGLGVARRRVWAGALAIFAIPFVVSLVFEEQDYSAIVSILGVALVIGVLIALAALLIRALGFRIRIERTDA